MSREYKPPPPVDIVEVPARQLDNVRETQAGITTEQKDIPATAQPMVSMQRQALDTLQFVGRQITFRRFFRLNPILVERMAGTVYQTFLDCQIDIRLQVLHVLGDSILMLRQRSQVLLEVKDKLMGYSLARQAGREVCQMFKSREQTSPRRSSQIRVSYYHLLEEIKERLSLC